MEPLFLIAKIGIYVVMAATVLGALAAVNLSNIFHSALGLAAALVGVALLFVALGAEFLAAAQILIYIGAVMTLLIFAIMLTQGMGKAVRSKNELRLIAAGVCLIFFTALVQVLNKTHWPMNAQNLSRRVSTADLGTAFLGHFVFPFEVISVILLAALVGALIIAKKEES